MKKSCEDTYDEMDCRAAVSFCSSEIEGPYHALGPLGPVSSCASC
jgi:hypothetical protein